MGQDQRESAANESSEDDGFLSRRHFLAAQSLFLSATAGCFGSDDGMPTGTETPTGTPTDAGMPTGTETPTDAPTPTDAGTTTATETPEDGMPTRTESPAPGGDREGSIRNTVSVSTDDRTESPVSDQIVARLNEHYCSGTIYPGVYSEHVKNPAFYPRSWSQSDFFGPKTFFDPAQIERADGIPFPWEPAGTATYEQRAGGVAAVDTTDYQRITVDGSRGGVAQKIVLPDFRTLEYDLSVSVRGTLDTVTVEISALEEPADNQYEVGETVATAEVEVTGEWQRTEVALTLSEALGDQFDAGGVNVETPYGEYHLSFTAEGAGHVDLDWVNLAAADAVNGKFNPTTVELLREKNATWLKWPGGNFTSQYYWRDGVGPLEERPSRFNYAWGGVDPNYFGTAEYLELCELCDLTPRITVGWSDDSELGPVSEITAEEAAQWVEYCNGSTDTEMGALRAEHGHPEPYDVTHWEVGNEVYGSWQRGSTQDPQVFAAGGGPANRKGFNTYYDKMTAVDDSISVYADAMSPQYDDPNLPNPENWNSTLFELSGDRLDGINLHHYSWGIEDDGRRQQWYADHTQGTPQPGYWIYSEVLIMFPTQFGQMMADLAAKAADAGVENLRINVGEWGLFPTVDGPYPGPETMPGGSYFAGMLNSFIRQSEHVREACNTWVPVKMFPPEWTQFPPDPNPLAPAGTVHTLYSKLFEDDREWHAVDVGMAGANRTIPETGDRINRMEDVPYVDAAAMQTADGSELAVFATNRNLWQPSEVTVEVGEEYAGDSVAVTRLEATAEGRPLPHAFQTEWGSLNAYEVRQSATTVADDGTLELELGPAGVVRLLVDGDGDGPVTENDGVWTGIDGVLGAGRPYTADGG